MQNPDADTQWNDVLRAKGIIPQKETEISEADIVNMVEATIHQKAYGKGLEEMDLDELAENEDDLDEDDERMFEEYRRQRMAELREAQQKARYGDVREISKDDYVREVNKAGEGVWVVLHVYKNAIPLCKLVNEFLYRLATKFPETKFLKSVSSVCIPNYPDKNLPTIFVYHEGDMKKQFVGPVEMGGMNLKVDDLEWMLKQAGAVKSNMEANPRKGVDDVMASSLRRGNHDDDDDDDDY